MYPTDEAAFLGAWILGHLICTMARGAILKIRTPAPPLGQRERLQGLAGEHLGQLLSVADLAQKRVPYCGLREL